MTFGTQVVDYHLSLEPNWELPPDISIIYPYDQDDVRTIFKKFYKKFFDDKEKRHFLFGINPGRFGAGVTGIPFTDPITLEAECGLTNNFRKKNELSSIFVYEFIKALGGVKSFYSNFYITSLCPLGFIKDKKNYNYYDDKELQKAVEQKIIDNIDMQMRFGCFTDVAFSMGKGKNFEVLKKLNDIHHFFQKVVPLPHPRWVMQYRLKSKTEHLQIYQKELGSLLN